MKSRHTENFLKIFIYVVKLSHGFILNLLLNNQTIFLNFLFGLFFWVNVLMNILYIDISKYEKLSKITK
jgi:hypothetical protein